MFRFNLFNYRLSKRGLSFFFWLLLTSSVVGQATNIGIPFTTNYPNEIYQAGTQNWDIDQHPNGFMFFANNNGLLQFDGLNWELFPLNNKTIARSIHITKKGRIYVGGQGAFGFFEPNEQGQLIFNSLSDLVLEPHNNFADVWTIIEVQQKIYFTASNKVFIYDGKNIQVLESGVIDFLENVGQQIFVRNEKGLHQIVSGAIKPFKGGEKFANIILKDITLTEDKQLLFSTLHRGLLTINNEELRDFQNNSAFFNINKIHHSANLGAGKLAIGTANGGLVILEKTGKILYKLDRKHGLQNNQILNVFKDKADNLWLGLNNGIDYVLMNSPFTKLLPGQDKEGTAYDAKIFKDKIYLGTSAGLYAQPWQSYYDPLQPDKFKLLSGSNGQVWGLDILKDELFLGHHDGGFLVKDQHLKQISTTLGNWKIIPLNKHPNYFLMGTYEGLVLYHRKGKDWQRIKKYDNFKESCRIIEQDPVGNIWVSHPYRGIYKVKLAPDLSTIKVKLYGAAAGLPSNNLNHVFKINDAIVFTGETGIYKYHEASDRFTSYPELSNLLGPTTSIHRFFEDRKGNIWFVTSEETGILTINDRGVTKSFTKKVYPELNNKLVRGFEFIYPYDEHNVFIGAEKGFIHYNPSKDLVNEDAGFTAHIVKVRAINSSDSILIHGQYNSIQSNLLGNLSAENNALRFSYAATDYRTKQALCYATKLEGYENEWSAWSTKTEKDFTNLNAGDYHFLVKAKSIYEEESEIASFSFKINSPWYATTQAIVMYVLLSLVFLSGLILVPRRKFQVERAALEATQKKKEIEHQKVVAQSEQAIISLKNEQLEAQIAHKNSELAISTMHLVQRSELIHQLQERLNKVARNTKDTMVSKELRKVNRLLKENTQVDDLWNQFAIHFDQVHIDFLQKMQEKFPQLTANDQKLCAYLRMNLSTKEIAPLMNISIRGVEVARYRLRKKLNLESTINLNKFMLEL